MFLTTRELTLVSDEYIRIWERLKEFYTPHMMRNTMVLVFANSSYRGQVMAFVSLLQVFYEMRFVLSFYNALYWRF